MLQHKWKLSEIKHFFSSVPYLNATAAAMLCQYPSVYGGPPVMYPSMTMLQPATAQLQAPGAQPYIAEAATGKQESKVCE